MVLDAESVIDRRRLKRRLTAWRIAAVALGLLFLGALVLNDQNMASSAGGILPHVARVTVSGVITGRPATGPSTFSSDTGLSSPSLAKTVYARASCTRLTEMPCP